MKVKIILLLIVIASIAKQSYGQNDSTKQGKKRFENFYAPWHRTINDTSKWNVSKVGVYLSQGFGLGNEYGIVEGAHLSSLSVAYKSHLVTVTYAESNNTAGVLEGNSYQQTNYVGFLLGESLRYKHFMLSISGGIAASNIYVTTNYSNWNPNPIYNVQKNISFPIEVKTFLYARNGIGIGLHFSKNIISPSQYSPFYFGVCVVFGYWNIHKK